MILVHRLKGDALFVNADLIESVEARPDTVLTLVDGRRQVVAETPDEIIGAIIEFRAAVLRAAESERARRPALTLLPSEEG